MDLRDKLSSLDVAPGKILKIVLALALVLLLLWVFTLSHINYNQGPDGADYINEQNKADSSQVVSLKKEEAPDVQSYESSSSIFTNGLVTFFVLLVVLIIIWFWIDRKQCGGSSGIQREVSSQVLGEGARVKIIRINEEVWVLGVTSNNVNLLHRYQQNEWKENIQKEDSGGDNMFRKLFKSQVS